MAKISFPYLVEDRDRHGNVRIYFRRPGHRKVRIHEEMTSAAFAERYRELMRRSEAGAPLVDETPGARQPARPGTWRWLCIRYLASSEYSHLDLGTQRQRRSILESTYDEPVCTGSDETYSNFPLSRLGTKAVRVLRDRKAATPTAANQRVKVIKAVYNWALADEPPPVKANPARDVPFLKVAGTGFHSWTIDEVRRFEAHYPVGTTARLALAIFLFTGMRRSDAVRLGRQHRRDGWFHFRQFKGRNRSPVDIEIPVLTDLDDIIAATPKTGDLTYLVTSFGKPFTDAGFGNKMREWCNAAGLPHCSAHGLRKAGAAIAAENGATANQLMSIFGWMTIKEAERYTRAAARRKMAGDAMHLLRRGKS